MKIESVIIIGPSGEFYPLTNENTQKFNLPFLNTPLLELTINYLKGISSRIFIFCLNKHVATISNITKCYKIPIIIKTTECYEGTSYILKEIRGLISSNIFILCKGDIYGLENIHNIIDTFKVSGVDIFASVQKRPEDGSLMCFDDDFILKMYDQEDIPLVRHTKLYLTSEYSLKDFFVIKKAVLDKIPENLYSFKSNVIQYLLKQNTIIKCVENRILQIKNINDYLKQLDFKNNLLELESSGCYNLLGTNCSIGEKSSIEDSIVGDNCIISYGSVIKRSIIMDNVVIEPYTTIEACVVSRKSIIKSKSILKNCKVGENYVFQYKTKAEYNTFSDY